MAQRMQMDVWESVFCGKPFELAGYGIRVQRPSVPAGKYIPSMLPTVAQPQNLLCLICLIVFQQLHDAYGQRNIPFGLFVLWGVLVDALFRCVQDSAGDMDVVGLEIDVLPFQPQ